MSRSSKLTSQYSEDFWANQLEKSLEKTAVQPRRVDDNLFGQINSIVNNTSRFSSVDDAVVDMMQRSGYSDYKKKISSNEQNIKAPDEPKLFKEHVGDSIKAFINNRIKSTSGRLDVGAIISDIMAVFSNQVSDKKLLEDPALALYIHKENNKELKNSPEEVTTNNIGLMNYDDVEAGPENTDAFHGLTPSR